MAECFDFSPYTTQFQQRHKCKRTSQFCSRLLGLKVRRTNVVLAWLFFPPSTSHSSQLDQEEEQRPGKPVHLPVPPGEVFGGLSEGHRSRRWSDWISPGGHPQCSVRKPGPRKHRQGRPDLADPACQPALQTRSQWAARVQPAAAGKGVFLTQAFYIFNIWRMFVFFFSKKCDDFILFPSKLEKLVAELLGCLQSCSALAFDSELLDLLSPLLCVLFPHKNKQFRTSVTHFWNSTFANSVSLTYPDDIR